MPYSQEELIKEGRANTISGSLVPLGYSQITNLVAAVGLGAIPAGARMAVLIAETAAVRWRDDGTDPTATVGMPLAVNTPTVYTGDLSAFKVIQQAVNAVLNVAFYG